MHIGKICVSCLSVIFVIVIIIIGYFFAINSHIILLLQQTYSGNIAMNGLQPQPLQHITPSDRSGGDGGISTKQNPSSTVVISSSHSSSATSDDVSLSHLHGSDGGTKRKRLSEDEVHLMRNIRNAIDPICISGIMMRGEYTKSRITKDLSREDGAALIMKMKHSKKRSDMAKTALSMVQQGSGPSLIQYLVRGSNSFI